MDLTKYVTLNRHESVKEFFLSWGLFGEVFEEGMGTNNVARGDRILEVNEEKLV